MVMLVAVAEIYTCCEQQALDCCCIASVADQGDVLPCMTGPAYSADDSFSGEDGGIQPEG